MPNCDALYYTNGRLQKFDTEPIDRGGCEEIGVTHKFEAQDDEIEFIATFEAG